MLVSGFLKSKNLSWTLGLKFLIYIDGINGYRLWGPTAYKVVISRNVVLMNTETKSTVMLKLRTHSKLILKTKMMLMEILKCYNGAETLINQADQ